jgi:thiol:disulfide interchange protein DsbD
VSNNVPRISSQTIQFQPYSNDIFQQAKKQNKLVLIFAGAEWCEACQKLTHTIANSPNVISYIKLKYIPTKLDIDTQQVQAIKYKLSAMPTLIIANAAGNVLSTSVGEISEKELITFLQNSNQASTNMEQMKHEEYLLSQSQINQLNQLQNNIYLTHKFIPWDANGENSKYVDNIGIEYAMTEASQGDINAEEWVESVFYSELSYLQNQLNQNSLRLNPIKLALNMRLYSLGYSYWRDPRYLNMMERILYTLDHQYSVHNGLYYDNNITMNKYPSINGLVMMGLIYAYMATGDDTYLNKAQQTSRQILQNDKLDNGGYGHGNKGKNDIYLSDTAAMGMAYVLMYTATTDKTYLNHAKDAANFIEKKFLNKNKIGFISHVVHGNNFPDTQAILSPDENVLVMRFMNILYYYTGDEAYHQMSINALRYLSLPEIVVSHSPGYTLMTYLRYNQKPLCITVVGSKSDPIANSLFHTALSYPEVYSMVQWWDRSEGRLPNQKAEYPDLGKSAAYVCANAKCSPPIFSPQDLSWYIYQLRVEPTNKIVMLPKVKSSYLEKKYTPSDTNHLASLLSNHNVFITLIGFWLVGIVLSFTPCLLPLMIMIAGLLGGGLATTSKSRIIKLALTYVFALALTYAISGLIVATLGIYIQAYLQNTWIIIAFSLIFLILSFKALDIFNYQIPMVWRRFAIKQNNFQASNSYVGVAIMGTLATLIASPCLAGPLAAILSYVGSSGQVMYGTLVLFAMGLGIGTPLMFATLFGVKCLPNRGPWQYKINQFFGIILLGASIWLIGRILPEQYTAILWSGLIIFIALCMGVFSAAIESNKEKLWKMLTILVLAYGLILFATTLTNNTKSTSIFSTHIVNSESSLSAFHPVKDMAQLKQSFYQASNEHTPIILFFYSDWCESCHQIESDMFSDEQAKYLMIHFKLLDVNLSVPQSAQYEIADHYKIIAPPAVLFFDEHGNQLNYTIYEDVGASKFSSILMKIKRQEGVNNES